MFTIIESTPTDNLVQIGLTIVLAVATALALSGIFKAGARPWQLVTLMALPVALVFLNDGYRDSQWHGFMHASITYEIADGRWPLEDPLLAGQLLHYPYGHHFMIAMAMRFLPLTPQAGFAWTNVLAIIVTTVILYRLAAVICPRPVFCAMAVVLGMAAGPLVTGPVAGLISRLGGPRETRHMPYVEFLNIQSNQLGLLFSLLMLLGLAYIVSENPQRRRGLTYLVIGLLGAGFLYPLDWLPAVLSIGCSSLILLIGWRTGRRAAWLAIAVLIPTAAAAAPFMHLIGSGRAAESNLRVIPAMQHLVQHVIILALALVPPVLVIATRRAALAEAFRATPRVAAVLLTWITVPAIMYVMLFFPLGPEYKFLALAMLPLGQLTALAVESWHRARPLLGLALVTLWLISPAWVFATILRTGWPVLDNTWADGTILRHRDPAEDQLYRWIGRHTPLDSVFLDTYLTIPALAHRMLFVGLDTRRKMSPPEETTLIPVVSDGWTLTADEILGPVMGEHRELVDRRRAMAETFFSTSADLPDVQTLRHVLDEVNGRPVYVVARDSAVAARLHRVTSLKREYETSSVTVFRISQQ
jgi:hypothetical protein